MLRPTMTYGNRMPIPEAVTAATSTGRHAAIETADDLAVSQPAALGMADGSGGAGPVVTDDSVEFRFPDADHELDGVRLEVDWILGDIDPEFSWADGEWTLRIPRPDAWRLEYQLTLRRGDHYQWTTDPGNPRRVGNPFGDKSEIRFPDYREPNWLLTEPTGPLRWVDTPAGRLTQIGAGAAVVAARTVGRHRRSSAAGAMTAPTWPAAGPYCPGRPRSPGTCRSGWRCLTPRTGCAISGTPRTPNTPIIWPRSCCPH